jgi:hypothetical protein
MLKNDENILKFWNEHLQSCGNQRVFLTFNFNLFSVFSYFLQYPALTLEKSRGS